MFNKSFFNKTYFKDIYFNPISNKNYQINVNNSTISYDIENKKYVLDLNLNLKVKTYIEVYKLINFDLITNLNLNSNIKYEENLKGTNRYKHNINMLLKAHNENLNLILKNNIDFNKKI